MIVSRPFVCVLAFTAFGCGHAAGTHPSDMSAAEHQAAAKQESLSADHHASQFDPAASTEGRSTCGGALDGGDTNLWLGVCWTELVNPTEEHRKQAETHRELAAKHRAAAAALAEAEAQACEGIADVDRDMSPFSHRADIRSVPELWDNSAPDPARSSNHPAGATVTLNAVPGLTKEWLQRLVSCHLARNASVGHDMPEMPYCPLVPKGATAEVRSVDGGFAVDIRAEDSDAAAEIVKRAQALRDAPAKAATAATSP